MQVVELHPGENSILSRGSPLSGTQWDAQCGELATMDSQVQKGVRRTFNSAFRRFLIFLIGFGFDSLTTLVVFAVFVLFAWVLGLARTAGLGNEEQFAAYASAHFWLNYGLYVAVGIAFFLRTIRSFFGGE